MRTQELTTPNTNLERVDNDTHLDYADFPTLNEASMKSKDRGAQRPVYKGKEVPPDNGNPPTI